MRVVAADVRRLRPDAEFDAWPQGWVPVPACQLPSWALPLTWALPPAFRQREPWRPGGTAKRAHGGRSGLGAT